jgi:hypothetical protein
MTSDMTLVPGDVLKIERRYLVDGVMQTRTTRGTFAGVQVVGTAEHLVIEGGRNKKATRLVPLHSVSEITLVKAMPRQPKVAPAPEWDPGFA